MADATFQLPKFSMRFLPIWRRNFMVWKKLAAASILGNIADPLITLIAFGYGLGSLLKEIGGVPYIHYLASGSICMSIMMAASFEALYSAFSRMHVQKTWEALLNAPLSLDDIVLAEALWAATKAVFSAVAILLVMFALGIGLHPQTLLALPLLFLLGLCFAAIGLVVNAVARGYDFFTYYFTLVLTPMIFLSGYTTQSHSCRIGWSACRSSSPCVPRSNWCARWCWAAGPSARYSILSSCCCMAAPVSGLR